MGMHIGIIAAKSSVAQFREAFLRAWPEYELAESADDLADSTAVAKWKASHEQFVSAADWRKDHPGRTVYVFWQDGAWALMMGDSYVLAMDEDGLKRLSTHLGTVISFVVESASGCADFSCYENGLLRRMISNNDGDVTTVGDPLPEERGILIEEYYMDETEALARAFGLSPFDDVPAPHGGQAICVIDRTDYGSLMENLPQRPPPPARSPAVPVPSVQQSKPGKPWWKLW